MKYKQKLKCFIHANGHNHGMESCALICFFSDTDRFNIYFKLILTSPANFLLDEVLFISWLRQKINIKSMQITIIIKVVFFISNHDFKDTIKFTWLSIFFQILFTFLNLNKTWWQSKKYVKPVKVKTFMRRQQIFSDFITNIFKCQIPAMTFSLMNVWIL